MDGGGEGKGGEGKEKEEGNRISEKGGLRTEGGDGVSRQGRSRIQLK